MHWEKKITIRITFRRIVGAILAASTVANIVIVGAVVEADSPAATSTMTSTSTSIAPLWTATLFLPTAESGAGIPITATLIAESTPTATQTLAPTETFTPTPSATPTDLPPLVCIKRFYWPGYRVRAGDTLFSIASASGTTVNELMRANCRSDDRLFIGELIYVPRQWSDPNTITPTASQTPTGSDTPTPTASATPTQTDAPTPTYTSTAAPTDTPTATPTEPLPPTSTSTPTPTWTPTNARVACDQALFISDVNVPLGTRMLPGTTFTKTWRVKNVGACTWTPSYQIVFYGGEQMGAPASSSLQKDVVPGQSIDISVTMTAPRAAGAYIGYWMLQNANGTLFDETLWLEIVVSDAGPTPTATPTSTPDLKLTFIPGAAPSLAAAP